MSIKEDFLLQIKNYLIHNSDKCEDLVNNKIYTIKTAS